MAVERIMIAKNHLKKLIDELADAEAGEVLDFVEFLSDKSRRRAQASVRTVLEGLPVDDEPEASAEASAVAASRAETGPNVTSEEARRRLLG